MVGTVIELIFMVPVPDGGPKPAGVFCERLGWAEGSAGKAGTQRTIIMNTDKIIVPGFMFAMNLLNSIGKSAGSVLPRPVQAFLSFPFSSPYSVDTGHRRF